MRIIILDEDFQTLGVVGIFSSLIWTRRYYENGSFEIHAPSEYFELLNTGRYLYRNDRTELGVIREVNYSQTDKGERAAYAKVYFAESLLDDRVIQKTENMTGTPEVVSRALMNKYVINPSDAGRKMPHIQLGALAGIGTSTIVQATGKTINEKMHEVEKTQEQTHRLRFDYVNNKLIFEVWQGKDRTDTQDTNSWAIFSDSFYNVKGVVYSRDSSSAKNYAYVAGEGEGQARTVVEVDVRASSSEERRELYVDARDLQSTYSDEGGTEHSYTPQEYREMLRQRGLEKLEEYLILEKVDSQIDPNANLKYMEDFDIGDLCLYQNTRVGIECNKRITEVQEIYEGASMTLTVVFGNDESTSITKIIKREVS